MSRPAQKWQRERTTVCPTCGMPPGCPCVRLPERPGYSDGMLDRGEHVSPHAARLRAEEALRIEQGKPPKVKRTREEIQAAVRRRDQQRRDVEDLLAGLRARAKEKGQ